MIRIKSSGSTARTEAFLKKAARLDILPHLHSAGRAGVLALQAATPKDTGLAASQWDYEVSNTRSRATVTWINRNHESGFPVAVMLQYGYATGTGGYVQGRDYINPALKPIFDKLADDVWREVTRG